MIHAATPAIRVPLRMPLNQPLARRRAAVQGWFGRKIAPHLPEIKQEEPQELFWGINTNDAKDFLMAYCACFMAVIGFIA